MELTEKQIDQILTDAEWTFRLDFDAGQEKGKEHVPEEGWVTVQIPTSGYYNGFWDNRLEDFSEVMEDGVYDEMYQTVPSGSNPCSKESELLEHLRVA